VLTLNSKSYFYLGAALLAVLMTVGCNKASEEKSALVTEENSSATDQQVVASVNGTPISQHQLDQFIMGMNQSQHPGMGANLPKNSPEMKKAALNKLIQVELLYQESLAKNLATSAEEVDKKVNEMKAQFPDEDQFQKLLAASHSSEKALREDIQRNLSIERLVNQEVLSQVVVTEEEASSFYQEQKNNFKQAESVQISHILVKLDKEASSEDEAAAKQKIENIKNSLSNGEDFAELAGANSDCPSAKKGGDLGYVKRGDTVPEFEQCAFGLQQPGQISEIIKTSFGFHILKSGQKQPEGITPYEEVQEKINQFLKNQKLNAELEKYIQKLQAKATIESEFDFEEPPANMP
jgi:peptidyl-prolyl cis-trans isomerase C